MTYLVYARKFRPQGFEDVVGQEPIVTTLRNAIRQKRVSQNFLFSGPRGVGKTSTARILAKALNCEKGPTETPCDKCRACQEIIQGNSLDVLEIDGASNRGIDEVRGLRETVKFKPAAGPYKIYIIDEVHMLTTEAFNALLKTLEEPPPHVKFIFATTEAHKVPLTILSRCQRFNFKRISVSDAAEKLQEIVKKEKVACDKKALFLIAKAGDGALRDSEGILDQLVSFCDKKITEEDVLSLLSLAPEETYFEILRAVLAGDAKKIFGMIRDLHEQGGDLVQFSKGLFEFFRHLLFVKCSEDPGDFVEMSPEALKELQKFQKEFSKGQLLLALSLTGNLQNQMRRQMAPPKLLLESTLLKLIHLEGMQSLQTFSPQQPTGGHTAPPKSFQRKPAAAPSVPSQASPAKKKTGNARPADQVPGPQPGEDIGLNQVEAAWPRVIEYVKSKRMSSGIFLSESEPVEVNGTVVTLGFPSEFQFHKEMLEKESGRQLIEEAMQVALGAAVRVQLAITERDQTEKVPEDPLPEPASTEEDAKLPEMITEALNIFEGAKLVRKDP